MRQFDLKEYLANPNKKVVTRSGKNVTIHCTNYQGAFPIVAEIEGLDTSMAFTIDGVYGLIPGSNYDLFFAPEKHEGWINLYKNEDGISWISPNYFTSKEEAEKTGKECSGYITTPKIEWEE